MTHLEDLALDLELNREAIPNQRNQERDICLILWALDFPTVRAWTKNMDDYLDDAKVLVQEWIDLPSNGNEILYQSFVARKLFNFRPDTCTLKPAVRHAINRVYEYLKNA